MKNEEFKYKMLGTGFLNEDYIDYFWWPNMSRQELVLYIRKQIENRDERKKLERNEEITE